MIKRCRAILLVISLLAGWPQAVWAIQAHGGPEGLHVHQLAHLFFAFSMGLLIYWLRKWGLARVSGWRWIQYAALFFIFWNMDAIAGHWLEEQSALIEIHYFGSMRIDIRSPHGHGWLAWIYYLAKLDHLLCVPALLFLWIGLRRLLHMPPTAGRPNGVA